MYFLEKYCREVALKLSQAGVTNAHQEARWLVTYVAKKSEHDFNQSLLSDLLSDRIDRHKPLAYIFGEVEFCGLSLEMKPPILIPRLETEEWCWNLISQLTAVAAPSLKILDACTGSGCLALALVNSLKGASVVGVDISREACELALKNAARVFAKNVSFVQSDINIFLEKATDRFDLVVANPPYLSSQEMELFFTDSLLWEDQQALYGGSDGLDFYRGLILHISKILRRNDILPFNFVVECGYRQAADVASLIESSQGKVIEVGLDFAGYPRIIKAQFEGN